MRRLLGGQRQRRRRAAACSAPALPIDEPVRERLLDDRPGGPVELDARAAGRARAPRRTARGRRRAAPIVAHVCEELVVDRLEHGARGGAGDRVAAEGRGVVARLEARSVRRRRRATRRSAGRSRAPWRASPRPASRRAAPRRRTRRCGRRRSAPRRGRAARRARRRARAPRRVTPARADARRPRPARARAGSRPCSAPTCSASVSGVANTRPGRSGSNAARFAGCPVTESAPNVRPWNEPSSATTSVRPVALRAHLSAASIDSAPELQKNALAPPKRSDSSAASSLHRLGEVEVRHVPEPVELRVGGRERRRMAVAEPDDCDAGEEVEVALAGRRRSSHAPSPSTNVTGRRA